MARPGLLGAARYVASQQGWGVWGEGASARSATAALPPPCGGRPRQGGYSGCREVPPAAMGTAGPRGAGRMRWNAVVARRGAYGAAPAQARARRACGVHVKTDGSVVATFHPVGGRAGEGAIAGARRGRVGRKGCSVGRAPAGAHAGLYHPARAESVQPLGRALPRAMNSADRGSNICTCMRCRFTSAGTRESSISVHSELYILCSANSRG